MDYSVIKNYSYKLYLFGLILFVVGLPISKIFLSIGAIVLFGSCLIHGGLKNKFSLFKKNKAALLATSIFILYTIGGIHSMEVDQYLKELRIILPLLLLPFVFSAMPPLDQKTHKIVLHFFVLAVLFNSVASYLYHINSTEIEYRNVVMFISHIRYALMVVFSIHILFFYALKSNLTYKVLSVIVSCWLIYFMNVFGSGTGFVILLLTVILGLFYYMYKFRNKRIFYGITIAVIVFSFISIYQLISMYNNYFDAEEFVWEELDVKTQLGEKYLIMRNKGTLENGNYLWKYYAPSEMLSAWNSVSDIKSEKLDNRGHVINGTLLRYLTSMGLRKDASGVSQLSKEDIKNIQDGHTNYLWSTQNGIERRVNEVFYEIDRFKMGFDPSSSPTIRRLHFWDAAIEIIKDHPLIGVGTGDVKKELLMSYEKLNSPLKIEARKLVHNQYLTAAVMFGLFGMIWLFVVLFYPFFGSSKMTYLGFTFISIIALSCISEDTFNTQTGISLFTIFYCFFFVKQHA